jgi:hypothetical protein
MDEELVCKTYPKALPGDKRRRELRRRKRLQGPMGAERVA